MSEGTDEPVVTDPIDPAGVLDDEDAVDRAGSEDGDPVDATDTAAGPGTAVLGRSTQGS